MFSKCGVCIFQHMSSSVASVPSLRSEPTAPISGPPRVGVLSSQPPATPSLQSRILDPAEGRSLCWWLGVHGGAGETTLAHLFAGVRAAEHEWPVSTGRRVSVVLIARTNFWGMSAAMAAMRDWSGNYRDQVDVLGLVLVADRPGRLPRPLLDLQRHVEAGHDATWHLPWVERWSLGEVPSRENAPTKEVEALRLGLTAALKSAARKAGI